MELLLQGGGANWRLGPCLPGMSPQAGPRGTTHGHPPGPLGTLGPKSTVFFIEAPYHRGPGWCQHSLLGEVQDQPQICLIKPGVALVYDSWAAFAHSDTHTPSVPKFFCFLVSFPTRAGPQFQVWPLWPPPSALCPPSLLLLWGRGTARYLSISRNL